MANFELEPGKSYSLRLYVKNTSQKADIPWEATLRVQAHIAIVGPDTQTFTLLNQQEDLLFDADETKECLYPFNVPAEAADYSGQINAFVLIPDGAMLNSESANVMISGGGGGGAFDMAVVSATPGGVHFGALTFYEVRCSIHNPGDIAVTRQLTLKWQWDSLLNDPSDPTEYTNPPRWWRVDPDPVWNVYTLEVTLNPGETQELVSPREVPLPGYPGDYQVNVPSVQGGSYRWFMLFDELGNHSAPFGA